MNSLHVHTKFDKTRNTECNIAANDSMPYRQPKINEYTCYDNKERNDIQKCSPYKYCLTHQTKHMKINTHYDNAVILT